MKKGKLLILLVAILSLFLMLAACEKTSDAEQPSTDTQVGSSSEVASEETQEEVSTEAPEVKHEAHDYFVLSENEEISVYKEISKIDGTAYDFDYYGNLVLVRNQEIDVKNDVIDSVIIYDATSGEAIFETSVSYPLHPGMNDRVTLEVSVSYPVIRVSKMSYGEDGFEDYDVSYYFAKKDGKLIKNTDQTAFDHKELGNGLQCFVMGDSTVWIDKNMNIVSTADVIINNDYDVYEFSSEYMGYLYSWDYSQIQIFNRSGVCSGTYSIDHDGLLNAYVLNDGNVVLQELEPVDEYTEYDVTLMGQKFTVKSYIMNYVNGAMTEIELDFIIDNLCSKYGEDENYKFPFGLAAGHENQAYIYRFAHGTLSPYVEYVVLNNSLEIEYTLKNDMHGVNYTNAYATDSHHYIAHAPLANTEQAYLFDLDGNAIPITEDGLSEIVGKYIVTDEAILDRDLNVVYDFVANGFKDGVFGVDYSNCRIYMSKYNFLTGGKEYYLFDRSTKKEILIADGIKTEIFDDPSTLGADGIGDGYYVIHNIEDNTYTFYNTDGEAILVMYGVMMVYELNDVLIVRAEFEGDILIYTIQ